MPIANTCSIGYPHDSRADNAAYRHDRRADNAAYRHDRRADSLSPFTALIAQVNSLIRRYNTSLKFLLPSIIIYMKQNDVHKVIILYLYTRGRDD